MPKPNPISPSQKLFEAIAKEFAAEAAGITRSQMMGMPCLKVRGKMFAGSWHEAMVFKLAGEPHQKALALKGATLFDPSEKKRPMREWVLVPYTHRGKWRAFADAALAYVSSKT